MGEATDANLYICRGHGARTSRLHTPTTYWPLSPVDTTIAHWDGRTDRQTELFCSRLTSHLPHTNMRLSSAGSRFLSVVPNPSLFQYNAAGQKAACEGQCSVHAVAAAGKRLQGPNCPRQFLQVPIAALKQDPTLDLDPTNAGAIKHLSPPPLSLCFPFLLCPCLSAHPLHKRGVHSSMASDARIVHAEAGAGSRQQAKL